MEVKFADTFMPSVKRMIDSENPWHWRYYRSKWYDLKQSMWAKRKYRRVVKKMVPWDYGSILTMLKFQLEILSDYIEHKGLEVEESRMAKVKKMKDTVKLLNHKIEDDYADRCGYEANGVKFEETDDGMFKMKPENEEIDRHNKLVFKEARQLEEKEWEKIFENLKDLRSWWD